MDRLPKHIAFIMDGNRRWARERKLPLEMGHLRGYQRIEKLLDHAKLRGIKTVTFWAFSTENWDREKVEIDYLMKLFSDLFKGSLIKKIHKNKVKVTILGELDRFPLDIAKSGQ
jgi:undecaprenyl diphosphate synthase